MKKFENPENLVMVEKAWRKGIREGQRYVSVFSLFILLGDHPANHPEACQAASHPPSQKATQPLSKQPWHLATRPPPTLHLPALWAIGAECAASMCAMPLLQTWSNQTFANFDAWLFENGIEIDPDHLKMQLKLMMAIRKPHAIRHD